MPTWRTEWPSCLGLNPVFPRCSKTVFEAGPGLEAASSTQPADKQRDGITFAAGLGRLLGWEASEVTEGQARGTHQRRRPRGHRRQQQNELADEESLAAHLSVLRAVQFSLSKCREAPVPLPAKTPIAQPPYRQVAAQRRSGWETRHASTRTDDAWGTVAATARRATAER